MATGDDLSVVIPSWREGPRLPEALRAARVAVGRAEFVIAACDEVPAVRDEVLAQGAVWVEAPQASRGLQLKLGAQHAHGRHLMFLHADTRLPPDAGVLVRQALQRSGVAGGAFCLRFDRDHPVLALLGWWSHVSVTTAYLGDQCMFCTRAAYDAAGGFWSEPLFEDVELARRLARVGRLVRLPQSVTTSARRFSANGPRRQSLTNAALLLAFHAGVSPRRLLQMYAPVAQVRESGPARM